MVQNDAEGKEDQEKMCQCRAGLFPYKFLIVGDSNKLVCYIAGVFPATARPFIG